MKIYYLLIAIICVASQCQAQDAGTAIPESVKQYIDAKTIAVGWIDISKLDVDDLAKFQEAINGASPNMDQAKEICNALVQLGVTRIYWCTDLANVAQGPQGLIVPVPEEKRQVIATILTAVAAESKGVAVGVDNVVLVGNAETVKRLQSKKDTKANSTLIETVNRVNDPHGFVLLTPIAAVLPVAGLLPQLADGDTDRAAKASELLVNLQSITISGQLPPSNATIRVTTKSAEVAQRFTQFVNSWTQEKIPDTSADVQFATDRASAVLTIKSLNQAMAVIAAVQETTTGQSRPNAMNSLKQIALAMHNFHDVYGHFPPQALTDAKGKRLLSWRVMILPYLDQAKLYNEFHLDEPWDSEHNIKLVSKIPAVLKSTSLPGEKLEHSKTRFVAPLTFNSTFGRVGPGVRIQEITDGTSNTLMIIEASSDESVIWTKPEDLTINEADRLLSIINQNSDGFAACMCDGSARFFPRKIIPAAIQGILSINGGELIDLSNIE